MKRGQLINKLINKYDFKSYLEIGVRNPKDNFNTINIKVKESVDPSPKGPCTHIMTSDKFFQKNKRKYDIIFIDGFHDKDYAYRDIKNSVSILNDGGIIVIHDCNPVLKEHIKSYEEFVKTGGKSWYGTTFIGFIKAKNELKAWSCFVVDTDCGCGIITRRKLLANIPFEVPDLSWEEFDKNRKKILQLVSVGKMVKLL